MTIALPDSAVQKGSSPIFTEDSLPAALCREHALGPKRWGVLNILEGSVTFVDLVSGSQHELSAPQTLVIAPESPHKLEVSDATLRCRIDFFQETGS